MSSQTVARTVFLAVSLFLMGEGFVMNLGYIRGFGLGAGGDLDQDYCAAKAWLHGQSIYADLNPVCNTAKERGRVDVENFHPPMAAFVLLPFVLAGASIQVTFITWGVLMMLGYMAVVYLSMVYFEVPAHLRLALLGGALLWFPHISQSMNGQFSTVVLMLVFLGWFWLQQGKEELGGAALGAAIAVKLFPALLGVYLLATRRFRALGALGATFLVLQGLTFLAAGPTDFLRYYTSVMPEDSRRFLTYAMNQSFTGAGISLLQPNRYVEHIADWPRLGLALMLMFALGLVAWAAFSARRGEDPDHTYWHFTALSVILCPISWDHTMIVMVPLCVLLLGRFGGANQLALMFLTAGAMLLANHNDLESIRILQLQTPMIPLGELWQAKAQMLGAIVIVGASRALLSVKTLAIPAVRRSTVGSLPDWNSAELRRS